MKAVRKRLGSKGPPGTSRKWHMGYQMVTLPMTSSDPRRCCEAVRSAFLAKAWLLVSFLFLPYSKPRHILSILSRREIRHNLILMRCCTRVPRQAAVRLRGTRASLRVIDNHRRLAAQQPKWIIGVTGFIVEAYPGLAGLLTEHEPRH